MAILRSVDGKFYEVPDKNLEKYEIPADQLKDKLGDMDQAAGPGGPGGGGAGPGGPGGGGGGSQVVINIHGSAEMGGGGGGAPAPEAGEGDDSVQPYWGWWRNCWRGRSSNAATTPRWVWLRRNCAPGWRNRRAWPRGRAS